MENKVKYKGYKYRIYPDKKQEELINKTFGCVRFVYNKMLEDRIKTYEEYKGNKEELEKQKYPTPAKYKKDNPWLRKVDSLALANAQMDLNNAYKKFFEEPKIGYPKFKSRHKDRLSYTTNNQSGHVVIVVKN